MTDVFYTDYPQYTTILARCARLGLHAGRPKVFSFGQSVLGRELLCVGIGNLEDATLVVGGVHALVSLLRASAGRRRRGGGAVRHRHGPGA